MTFEYGSETYSKTRSLGIGSGFTLRQSVLYFRSIKVDV